MNEQRWTIEACPKCFARIDEEPRGCDHCEDGGYLEHIEVVPLAALREVLDQYRDIVGGMYAVRAKDPVTACGVLRRGMADATRLRAAFLDEYEGTTE